MHACSQHSYGVAKRASERENERTNWVHCVCELERIWDPLTHAQCTMHGPTIYFLIAIFPPPQMQCSQNFDVAIYAIYNHMVWCFISVKPTIGRGCVCVCMNFIRKTHIRKWVSFSLTCTLECLECCLLCIWLHLLLSKHSFLLLSIHPISIAHLPPTKRTTDQRWCKFLICARSLRELNARHTEL